jgi:hypothetical protein
MLATKARSIFGATALSSDETGLFDVVGWRELAEKARGRIVPGHHHEERPF